MIIRSQYKAFIINFEKVDTVCLGGIEGKSVITFTDAQVVTLGKYSTEENAIKVLDMIQDAYARCESARTLTSGIIFELAKILNQEQAEFFKKEHRENFVFQMPQDSEV